jgi:RimJ/RimL family protein N-acetyltransferase
MVTSIRAIDAYWAADLNCGVEDLHCDRITVTRNPRLIRHPEAFAFKRDRACVIAVPGALVDAVSAATTGLKADEVFNERFLRRLLGPAVERIVGPAWLGYADETDFHPLDNPGARLLIPNDMPSLHDLAGRCSVAEWEHSSIEFDREPVFCCFVNGRAVAAATYEVCGLELGHIGVITDPAHRGQGYGKAVVSAVTRYGLDRGLTMQYRTLESNTASVAIARSLGFQRYAATIAVRLKLRAS